MAALSFASGCGSLSSNSIVNQDDVAGRIAALHLHTSVQEIINTGDIELVELVFHQAVDCLETRHAISAAITMDHISMIIRRPSRWRAALFASGGGSVSSNSTVAMRPATQDDVAVSIAALQLHICVQEIVNTRDIEFVELLFHKRSTASRRATPSQLRSASRWRTSL